MPKVRLILSPNNMTFALVLKAMWPQVVMAHHVTFTKAMRVYIGGLPRSYFEYIHKVPPREHYTRQIYQG
jgi:hypothetical protein